MSRKGVIVFGVNSKIGLVVLVLVSALLPSLLKGEPQISFVTAKYIPGSFCGPTSLYVDSERIYLGSAQGEIFVHARNKQQNFPLLERVEVNPAYVAPINSICGEGDYLYVTTATTLYENGKVRVYNKSGPELVYMGYEEPPWPYWQGVGSHALGKKDMLLSSFSAAMDADENRIYLSPVNPGAFVARFPGRSMSSSSRPMIYGLDAELGKTTVYDRHTGRMIGAIPNPVPGGLGASIHNDATRLFLTFPGPAGPGVFIYNKSDLSVQRFIYIWGTNVVRPLTGAKAAEGRDLLVTGCENGWVDIIDPYRPINQSVFVSSINLRTYMGHTGPEDDEVRAVWCDGLDNLIFAATTWGNAQTHGPSLPSFYVLEVN